jgi:type III secretion protein N (ATPase)
MQGRVVEVTSLIVKAVVPYARVGDVCHIFQGSTSSGPPVLAEVVGFRDEHVFLMPLSDLRGIAPNSAVVPTGKSLRVRVGDGLLGRVLDGIGQPMDEGPALIDVDGLVDWAIDRPAPNPYLRQPVDRPLSLGVRAIDTLMTVGRGQRVGLFAGSGVGKSSLMGQIARNSTADVVVVCLVGERGREMLEFIKGSLGTKGLKNSVVVCATCDAPSLVRLKSCYVATAIAEWFRDQGKNVLLMLDSVTRFARAQREIGLALSEPPARQGYPPSVFALLPKLMERTGNNEKGSITALYTVLVQGGDMDEPIADEVRGILDGHLILNRQLAEKNHWPALDILPSLSRVMNAIVDPAHAKAAALLRNIMAIYEKNRDLILLGAYNYGTDTQIDYAIDKIAEIEVFLRQGNQEAVSYEQAVRALRFVVHDAKGIIG